MSLAGIWSLCPRPTLLNGRNQEDQVTFRELYQNQFENTYKKLCGKINGILNVRPFQKLTWHKVVHLTYIMPSVVHANLGTEQTDSN